MKHVLIGLMLTVTQLFAADPPGTHGMIVLGTETLYAYHLPMYHVPHQYQAIFEIELDAETKALYLNDKKASPNTLYTLVPQSLVLPDLAKNLGTVKAKLFHGHFEQGGKPLTRGIDISFKKTLLFAELDVNAPKPDHYKGLVFGQGQEFFMAHEIAGKPEFDQIAQVQLMNGPAVPVGGILPLDLSAKNEKLTASPELKVLKQIYFDTNDLSM